MYSENNNHIKKMRIFYKIKDRSDPISQSCKTTYEVCYNQ